MPARQQTMPIASIIPSERMAGVAVSSIRERGLQPHDRDGFLKRTAIGNRFFREEEFGYARVATHGL